MGYPKSEMYLGGYDKGKRSGQGKFVWSDGGFYQGSWLEGVYSGTGELVTSQTMYKGDFENGLYHGTGCLTDMSNNTVIFDGTWKEGLPSDDDTSLISNLFLQ